MYFVPTAPPIAIAAITKASQPMIAALRCRALQRPARAARLFGCMSVPPGLVDLHHGGQRSTGLALPGGRQMASAGTVGCRACGSVSPTPASWGTVSPTTQTPGRRIPAAELRIDHHRHEYDCYCT